jgi:hypothetical protein
MPSLGDALRVTLWIAILATQFAGILTAIVAHADHQPPRAALPRAIVRRR